MKKIQALKYNQIGKDIYIFSADPNFIKKLVKISDISNRVGKYFLNVVVNKAAAQKGDLSQEIFKDKIEISKAHFDDKGEEIFCGFLTKEQKEKDIVDIMKNLDSNLVKSIKFIRVEETNF